MTVIARGALVLAGLFLLGAALATFLPTSPQGATCGTWVAPEWTDAKTAELVAGYGDVADQSLDQGLANEAAASARSIVAAHRLCSEALDDRRTWTIVLLAGAVVVPAGVIFIGRGRRASGLAPAER